jgi:hypothetical protein
MPSAAFSHSGSTKNTIDTPSVSAIDAIANSLVRYAMLRWRCHSRIIGPKLRWAVSHR